MEQAHDQPDRLPRRSVRIAFWLFVLACWAIPALGLGGLVGIVLFGGRPSGVAAVIARSDPSAIVLQRLGPPSRRDVDGQRWADLARPDEGCKTEPVGEAWSYEHWFARDAVVIFDRTGRVQCVIQGSFFIRSH
jgi:hypothetical protein